MKKVNDNHTDVKIAVSLVLHNERKHIPRLVESLKNQSVTNFTLYVLDSASVDGNMDLLQSLYPDAKAEYSPSNKGFAKGHNYNAQRAFGDGADFLIMLNTDLRLDEFFIEHLLTPMRKGAQVGMIGPVIFRGTDRQYENRIQFFQLITNYALGSTRNVFKNRLIENPNQFRLELEGNYLSGAALCIRREVYQQVGLWNEDNFMYGDERDLCFRVIQSGWKIRVTSLARCWHFYGKRRRSLERYCFEYYYSRRNKVRFLKQNGFYAGLIWFLVKEFVFLPVKFRWGRRLAGIRLLKYYYLGMWHGLLGRTGKANIDF
ncbi:glycosyltransferase family 2 protein [Marinilabiliaceae bacterium JC017]|nr:glycosyltransferase family 2 protein [Marinilabiliaceae bacterium JC017]